MIAILDRLSEWLLPTLPNPAQGELACSFIFRAGTQLRQTDYAIVSEPGSKIAHLVPQLAFINHATALQECYVSKLPLAAAAAPLSRMLLCPQMAKSLESKPLSLIIGKAMRTGSILRGDPTNGEFFCWSLMDHVTLYPYFHPDGYIRGTREFDGWHNSIQKQYAMLLYEKFVLRERLSTLYDLINNSAEDYLTPRGWPVVDAYGREKPAKIHPMQKELEKVEKENLNIRRKVNRFRAEQKMLQKAYLRIVEVCSTEGLLVPADIWSRVTRNPITILRPLNPSHKRKAIDGLSRSSASRNWTGHMFSRAQKKQRRIWIKVHDVPSADGTTAAAIRNAKGVLSQDTVPIAMPDNDNSALEVYNNDTGSAEDDITSVEDPAASAEDVFESIQDVSKPVKQHGNKPTEQDDHRPTEGNGTPVHTQGSMVEHATVLAEHENALADEVTASVKDKIAPVEDEIAPIKDELASLEDGITRPQSDDTTSIAEWEAIDLEDVELDGDVSSDLESSSEVDATSDQSIALVPADLLAEELAEHLKLGEEEIANQQRQDSDLVIDDLGIDDLDSILSELFISKDLIQSVRQDFGGQAQRSVQLDVLEDLEATLTGLEWEFEQVSTVQNDVKKVLESVPSRGELTFEEVARAISEAGIDYLDLIDMFEDRVPDNQAGFAMLRDLIDEAGFVDELSGKVYKRGPVELGNIIID